MSQKDAVATVRGHLPSDLPVAAPVVQRLAGARMLAVDGSEWLDASSGGFGCGHPAVTAAIEDQLCRVALSSRILLSRPLAEAVADLAAFCPDPLSVSYLCNSGAEALDAALKLAKGTHPDRRRVLGLAGEDFGTLSHGLSLTLGRSPVLGLALAADPVPVAAAESLVERVDADTSAVVIAPAAPGRPLGRLSAEWWRALRERCTRHDVLLVLDERLTAPARLGRDVGAQLLGIVPDALVLGEPLGADVVPLGVMVTSRAAYDRVYSGHNPSLHGSTFGANPLSAATARAVLAAVRADDLPARQRDVARMAHDVLGDLPETNGEVAQFCADGSLVWLRLASADAARALAGLLAEQGVLVRPLSPDLADVVSLLPPLIAAPEDVGRLFERVREAVDKLPSTRVAVS